MMFGIDKTKSLKAISKVPLRYFGNVDANLEDVMQKGKQLVAKCYVWNHLKIEVQYKKTRLIVQINLQRHQHSAHSLPDDDMIICVLI